MINYLPIFYGNKYELSNLYILQAHHYSDTLPFLYLCFWNRLNQQLRKPSFISWNNEVIRHLRRKNEQLLVKNIKMKKTL